VDDLYMGQAVRKIYENGENRDPEWRRLSAIGKANNIVKLCSATPHRRVLEIGAGEGAVLGRLADLNFAEEMCAVEISETAVTKINERKISSLSECRLFDGYHLPYADGMFDLALLSHVVEHVEYPRKILYEAMRVANYIFLEVPLEENIRLASDFSFTKVGHINFFTKKSIRRLVQSVGLIVLSQLVSNPPYAACKYQIGRQAILRYSVKECLLRVLPCIATSVFTYHCALLCAK
jgi:ubiquinone/menaquinone biosynthesis C-methylase UbiE